MQTITIEHQHYPPRLREIPYPPKTLYVDGDPLILLRPALAVVGTRRPTAYGLHILQQLLAPVIRAGIVVVSGFALGIDGRAHQTAVDLGAPTVGVLGCGLDINYPAEHQTLRQRVLASGGALVSEFPLGTPPLRHHFPQRNRIISGLSQAVLLVEAGEKSGALITAKFAVDQNRDVLVVPGPITSPQSIGPLNWLKLGATPITSAEDILRVFSLPVSTVTEPIAAYQPQSSIESQIIEQLRGQVLNIDELVEQCRLDSSVVSATLSLLEINGAVRHLGGLVYSLV
jgi:DNA processing protein